MRRLPQRASLVAQTAAILSEAIASGEWARWLPGELELARRLHVSRVTLRAALAEMERANLIRAGQGRRREILRRPGGSPVPVASRQVVLLSPAPLHRLAASTVFWVDELRKHLDSAGWVLEVLESAAAYSRRPAAALEDLARRMHPAGWVLYRSTPEMQRWFSENARVAVIAGSPHPGIHLTSVDKDYAACCRHAAGRFVAAGHRRLALARPDTTLAGDLESAAGFRAGAGPRAEVVSATHDGSAAGIVRSLERLFLMEPSPTGLFVFHASHALTVLGWLQRRGSRVPRDVSVICRDDEPYLDFVVPSLTRYSINAALFARKISRLAASLVAGEAPETRQHRVMPKFVPGETLAEAPR
jgi:DNA-binding LacI/PurR family transcriptional regulator